MLDSESSNESATETKTIVKQPQGSHVSQERCNVKIVI